MNRRIRTFKPEFFSDGRVCSLPVPTRFLMLGLISIADDEGRFRAEPATIAGAIFLPELSRAPGECIANVSRDLRELVDAGILVLYEGGGEQYGALVNWTKHQRIDKPQKSRLPAPSTPHGGPSADVSRNIRESPASVRENPAPGSGIWDHGTGSETPPVVPPTERRETHAGPSVDRTRLDSHVLTATEIDLPMLEGLALQCIPTTGRRAPPMMLDNVSQRALYELVRQYGAEKVRDALLDCGGMEMPVKAAKKRLEGGSTVTQRRPGADPGVFRAKGPVACMEDGDPDEAFGPRLPEDQEGGSHAV